MLKLIRLATVLTCHLYELWNFLGKLLCISPKNNFITNTPSRKRMWPSHFDPWSNQNDSFFMNWGGGGKLLFDPGLSRSLTGFCISACKVQTQNISIMINLLFTKLGFVSLYVLHTYILAVSKSKLVFESHDVGLYFVSFLAYLLYNCIVGTG